MSTPAPDILPHAHHLAHVRPDIAHHPIPVLAALAVSAA